MASGDVPSIWIASSDLDGYFVAVFISPSGDGATARQRAWAIYTGPDSRPDIDPITGQPEWMDYHIGPDSIGFHVFELGDGYIGSDGEGRLQAAYPGQHIPRSTLLRRT